MQSILENFTIPTSGKTPTSVSMWLTCIFLLSVLCCHCSLVAMATYYMQCTTCMAHNVSFKEYMIVVAKCIFWPLLSTL